MTPSHRIVAGRSIRRNEALAEQALAEGWWQDETIGALLRRVATASPGQVMIIDGDLQVTVGEVYARAEVLGRQLLRRMAPGSIVSFVLPNWHEAAVIYFAAALAGMIVHPILPSLRESELAFMLADAESRMVFVPATLRDFDYRPMMTKLCAELAAPPEVVVLRGDPQGHTAFEDLDGDCRDEFPEIDPAGIQMVLYTSGTTGTPKPVLHSQHSIGALVRQLGQHWLIERGDTFLVPSPISHIGGSIYAFEMPLLFGTRAVLMEQWNGADGLRLSAQHSVTHLAGAPPFLRGLLVAGRDANERLPAFKLFVCGGASISPLLIEEVADWFERAVVTRVYGSTEVPVITVGTLTHGDLAHAANTDGKLGICEIKLVSHPAAGPGEGEIYARGPQMLLGYLRGDGESEVFDADGYYRTGDIGRWVDGDYLVISGRAKDIIIRHGENISPKEVEDIIVTHPKVEEVSIVGLPDARTGERACAVIVPRGTDRLTIVELSLFLEECGLARFKIPEQLEIWDSLPKNATGKVNKHVIRKHLDARI